MAAIVTTIVMFFFSTAVMAADTPRDSEKAPAKKEEAKGCPIKAPAKEVNGKRLSSWHYTSNSIDEGEFAIASNWAQGSGSGCGPSGNKPCQIAVDASDETELAAYLSGMSNADVLAINPGSKRN